MLNQCKKKMCEKSSPRHHRNSPREKSDGGSFLLGIWKKSPREKKINLRVVWAVLSITCQGFELES